MIERDWQDLVDEMRRTDPNVAAAAAERLHKQASLEDLPKLRKLLGDDDPFLREAAAWPISEIAGHTSLRELLIAYQRGFDEGEDNGGFTAALVDLASVDPLGCRASLTQLAASETGAIRENAVWLLEFCES